MHRRTRGLPCTPPLGPTDRLPRLAGNATVIKARPRASSPKITAQALAPGFVRQPFEMIDVVDIGYDTHGVAGLPATPDSPIRARPPNLCRMTGPPDTPHGPVQVWAISSLERIGVEGNCRRRSHQRP